LWSAGPVTCDRGALNRQRALIQDAAPLDNVTGVVGVAIGNAQAGKGGRDALVDDEVSNLVLAVHGDKRRTRGVQVALDGHVPGQGGVLPRRMEPVSPGWKSMVSPGWAAAIAPRSVAAPLSWSVVTVKVLGRARPSSASRRGTKDCRRAIEPVRD